MIKMFTGAMLVIGALTLSTGQAGAMTGTFTALHGAAKADLQKVHDHDNYYGRWRLRCDWDDYWCRRRYWRWRDEGRDWWWNDRGRHWHWDTYRHSRGYSWRRYCQEDPGDWRCGD